MKREFIFSILIVLLSGSNVFAQPPAITGTISAKGKNVTRNFTDLKDLERSLGTTDIDTYLPNYTQTTPVTGTLDLYGLLVRASYPDTSTRLLLEIPAISFTKEFWGSTRDESRNALIHYVETEGNQVLAQMIALNQLQFAPLKDVNLENKLH